MMRPCILVTSILRHEKPAHLAPSLANLDPACNIILITQTKRNEPMHRPSSIVRRDYDPPQTVPSYRPDFGPTLSAHPMGQSQSTLRGGFAGKNSFGSD